MAKTILIVDDASSLRTLVRLSLTRAGDEVLEAGDGQEALQALDKAARDGELTRRVPLQVLGPGAFGKGGG